MEADRIEAFQSALDSLVSSACCCICNEFKSSLKLAPCGHRFCKEDLQVGSGDSSNDGTRICPFCEITFDDSSLIRDKRVVSQARAVWELKKVFETEVELAKKKNSGPRNAIKPVVKGTRDKKPKASGEDAEVSTRLKTPAKVDSNDSEVGSEKNQNADKIMPTKKVPTKLATKVSKSLGITRPSKLISDKPPAGLAAKPVEHLNTNQTDLAPNNPLNDSQPGKKSRSRGKKDKVQAQQEQSENDQTLPEKERDTFFEGPVVIQSKKEAKTGRTKSKNKTGELSRKDTANEEKEDEVTQSGNKGVNAPIEQTVGLKPRLSRASNKSKLSEEIDSNNEEPIAEKESSFLTPRSKRRTMPDPESQIHNLREVSVLINDSLRNSPKPQNGLNLASKNKSQEKSKQNLPPNFDLDLEADDEAMTKSTRRSNLNRSGKKRNDKATEPQKIEELNKKSVDLSLSVSERKSIRGSKKQSKESFVDADCQNSNEDPRSNDRGNSMKTTVLSSRDAKKKQSSVETGEPDTESKEISNQDMSISKFAKNEKSSKDISIEDELQDSELIQASNVILPARKTRNRSTRTARKLIREPSEEMDLPDLEPSPNYELLSRGSSSYSSPKGSERRFQRGNDPAKEEENLVEPREQREESRKTFEDINTYLMKKSQSPMASRKRKTNRNEASLDATKSPKILAESSIKIASLNEETKLVDDSPAKKSKLGQKFSFPTPIRSSRMPDKENLARESNECRGPASSIQSQQQKSPKKPIAAAAPRFQFFWQSGKKPEPKIAVQPEPNRKLVIFRKVSRLLPEINDDDDEADVSQSSFVNKKDSSTQVDGRMVENFNFEVNPSLAHESVSLLSSYQTQQKEIISDKHRDLSGPSQSVGTQSQVGPKAFESRDDDVTDARKQQNLIFSSEDEDRFEDTNELGKKLKLFKKQVSETRTTNRLMKKSSTRGTTQNKRSDSLSHSPELEPSQESRNQVSRTNEVGTISSLTTQMARTNHLTNQNQSPSPGRRVGVKRRNEISSSEDDEDMELNSTQEINRKLQLLQQKIHENQGKILTASDPEEDDMFFDSTPQKFNVTARKTPTSSKKVKDSSPMKDPALNLSPVMESVDMNPQSQDEFQDCEEDLNQCRFITTGLNGKKRELFLQFKRKFEIDVSKVLDESVTHVVIDVNTNNLAVRTLKYIQAMALGKTIVGFPWIEESLKAEQILPINKFMPKDSGGEPGPQRAFLSFRNCFGQKLFQDFGLVIQGMFSPEAPKFEIEAILIQLGARIFRNLTDLAVNRGKKLCRLVIVEASSKNPEMKRIFITNQVAVVSKEWVLDSVGAFQIKNILPYVQGGVRKEELIAAGYDV